MKRILLPAVCVALTLFLITCQKTRPVEPQQETDRLLTEAHLYFTDSLLDTKLQADNPRAACPRSPQWNAAYSVTTSRGLTLVVPVNYSQPLELQAHFSGAKLFSVNNLAKLVFYHDPSGHIKSEMLTTIPDSIALRPGQAIFSGVILVETWSGARLDQLKYLPDHWVYGFANNQSISTTPAATAAASFNPITPDLIISSCTEISGYNYSADNPDEIYNWTEAVGCSTIYIPENPRYEGLNPADLGGIAGGRALSLVVVGGSNPITDIAAYFKCFSNSTAADHTYSATVCVSQPVPGSRQAWTTTEGGPIGSAIAGNPVNVGHTFLILTENAAGTVIVRNLGFYPQTTVNPAYPTDQGQLDDNEFTGYNISVTYNLTNQQFFDILNYASIGNNTGYLYDLSSNNCTTFALHEMAAGGINLPATQGSWPGGSGDDPGDLGEDIRSMALPPNATRNTVSNPHPNQGNCN